MYKKETETKEERKVDVAIAFLLPTELCIAHKREGSASGYVSVRQHHNIPPPLSLPPQVEFSPVDRCVASCSGDRTVKLWSTTDFSCLRTFQVYIYIWRCFFSTSAFVLFRQREGAAFFVFFSRFFRFFFCEIGSVIFRT